MAQIYKNQLMWKSEEQHKFKGDPIKDYITQGLSNVAVAAQNANDALNRVKDRQMADSMEVAKTQASQMIQNWEDFSGDYMERMESEAMRIWGEAYGKADFATKNRFAHNNPEAFELFKLQVSADVVKKVDDHVYTTKMNEIPVDVSGIIRDNIALGPGAIKQAVMNKVNEEQDGAKMSSFRMLEYLDKLQREAAYGAIYTYMDRGEYENAEAVIADPQFSGRLTPEEKSRLSMSIRGLKKQRDSAEGSVSITEVENELVDALVSAMSSIEDDLTLTEDEKRRRLNGLMTVAYDGKLSDAKAQDLGLVLPQELVSSLGEYDAHVRHAIGDKAWKQFSTNSVIVDNMLGSIEADAGILLDEYSDKSFSEWKRDDFLMGIRMLSDAENFYSTNENLRKIIEPLKTQLNRGVSGAAAYRDASLDFYKTKQVQVKGSLGLNILGVGTHSAKDPHLLIEENLSPQQMEYYRNGDADSFYEDLAQNFADASFGTITMINGNKESYVEGSYVQGIGFTTSALSYAPADLKAELGVDRVSNKELEWAAARVAAKYDKNGLLDSVVDEENVLGSDFVVINSTGVFNRLRSGEISRQDAKELVENAAKHHKAVVVVDGEEVVGIKDAFGDVYFGSVVDPNAGEQVLFSNLASQFSRKGAIEKKDGVWRSVAQSSGFSPIQQSNYVRLVREMINEVNPYANPSDDAIIGVASVIRNATFNNKEGVPLDEVIHHEQSYGRVASDRAAKARKLWIETKPKTNKD